MQRLLDTHAPPGSPERELAQAIAALERVKSTPARRQRIWAAVTARGRRRGRAGWVLLRPAIAGAILLAAGVAAAAATVGHAWVSREWHALTGPRHPAAATPSRPAVTASGPRVARAAAADLAPPAQPAPPVARPAVMRATAHARAAKAEDPTALVAAVRALRGEHDAGRAARLLEAYLRAYPHGALAEEALALQIEAAAALKRPQAAVFAQQYLRLYPTGRFRAAARQALDAGF